MNLKVAQPTSEIRPFQPSDSAAIDHVFRITADEGLRSSPDPRTLTYGSHIWCHPYPFLHKEHCFILATPSTETIPSHAVGYILSAPDTTTFSTRYRTAYFPTLPPSIRQPLPPGTDTSWRRDNYPNALLNKIQHPERWPDEIRDGVPGVLERYPAHLHIDVLPEWQGQGWGTKLMEACLQKLEDVGVSGVHLEMMEGNYAARAFYKAVGFRQWGPDGRAEWCMVIDL